uniref:Uncharacterized protein n=1 Tax=uncultured organism MedDCM-OCT-S08-C51 TaxID=743639 RepID=D6PJA1_9ZZZZ|nr:hypothetical protein [uncultured organism MedDCM-OCT-S08-C51]
MRVLSVAENGLQDDGIIHLAKALKNNSQLTTLILGRKNRIKGQGLRELARALDSNRRSSLTRLVCFEGEISDQVELLFSLKRAIELPEAETPAVDFGNTLHAAPKDDEKDPRPRLQALQNALYGDEAIRFFKAPLAFCIKSLNGSARMDELATFLIDDRNQKGNGSYVKPADAHLAVAEAIVLEDASDSRTMLELMFGVNSDKGVRTLSLTDQKTRIALMLTLHAARERAVVDSPRLLGCTRQQAGELWQHCTSFKDVSVSQSNSEGAVFVKASTMDANRDVELKEDLWLTAQPYPHGEDCQEILSKEEWLGSRPWLHGQGGRTALLLAIHRGRRDAAKLLVRRLDQLRCEWKDSLKKKPESHTLLLVDVTEQTRERLARLGVQPPSSECQYLLLRQWPDVVGVEAAERDDVSRAVLGSEALRVAAVRGMAEVVSILLKWRQKYTCDGTADVEGLVQPHLACGTLGMADIPDSKGRNLLHDVCRNLLPRDDGIRLQPMHLLMLDFAQRILDLQLTRSSHDAALTGKEFAYDKDSFGRLPIHYAAAFGHLMLLECLLERDIYSDLDIPDKDGWTPLGLAVSNGHLRCVTRLMADRADPLQPAILPRCKRAPRPKYMAYPAH